MYKRIFLYNVTKMKELAIVVDLDGTLVCTNTFKRYILFVAKEAIRSGRIDLFVLLGVLVAGRKLRLMSHCRMKYHILCATERFMSARRIERFVESLEGYANRSVVDKLHTYKKKQGYAWILSTAAPVHYASLISQAYGFDYCIATLMPKRNGDWKENVREEKCRRTLALLVEIQAQFYALFTDHYDDLPLLRAGKDINVLVNPSDKTCHLVMAEHIDFMRLSSKN